MKSLQELKGKENAVDRMPDLPMVLILKRKSVRIFPSGKKVALYHNDKLGLDIAVPYNDHEVAATNEEFLNEKEHDDMFGDYVEALKKHFAMGTRIDHPELSKMKAHIITKYGRTAHGHMHAAAEHYLNGHVAQASRHYARFERQVDEEFADVIEASLVDEAVIHKIHHIVKTKTDGEVVFPNGSRHTVSHPQAAHIMKLHTLLTPENKAAVEKLMGNAAGLKKIADFASENLEGKQGKTK